MNQDQEVPAVTSDLTRIGTLFGTVLTAPPCYQQADHYKATITATGPFPADWREPWHQEGNSCETDDSEQYVPDSDFNTPTVGLKPETAPPPMSEILQNLTKHHQNYSGHAYDNFDGVYAATYQPSGGCFYNHLYNRSAPQHAHQNGQVVTQIPIKEEPNDREYQGNYRYYDRNKASPGHVNKNSWRNQNLPHVEKNSDDKLRESPDNKVTTSIQSNGRRGSLQLWQFLVALLDAPDASAGCIAWTGRGMEFKLIEPEEVARRWGAQKNRPAMNYDKLSRSLRYYYEKGIMQKVAGERYVYKFVCDPEALFNMAYGPHADNTRTTQTNPRNENVSKTESHHIAYTDMLNLYNCSIAHPYQHLHPYLQESKRFP